MSYLVNIFIFKLFIIILLILGIISTNNSSSSAEDADNLQHYCGMRKIFCPNTSYRSLDGSCNNLQKPEWGSQGMPYGRLLKNTYSDGIYAFPLTRSGKELPNARNMSRVLYPSTEIQNKELSLITMQWGQIVTHDLSLTMGISQTLQNPTPCCKNGKLIDPTKRSSRCKAILRPTNDPARLEEGNTCIDFARTLTTIDQNCNLPDQPARPISATTAYLDLSLVYGNNDSISSELRKGHGGRLLTLTRNEQEFPPQDPNITAACDVTSPDEPCYYTGDVRVNQNTELSLLHVVLLREHNHIADALKHINPHWNDEILFQEARRILIACSQQITYYEYLPIHLGVENLVKNNLIYPNTKNHVNDYNSSVDPAVLVEFASAAFRFFHTAINGMLKKYTEDREEIGELRLSNAYGKPSVLELDDNFVGLARGLCTQTENEYDENLTKEITDFFFRLNSTYGDDVRAIDIQRSRDFGLVNYVDTRKYCGLSEIKTFDDLEHDISAENVEKLKSFYSDVRDVELLVAGSLEFIIPGTSLGPTFSCIILKQFYNTRVGDRFFFENGNDKEIAFTKEQLNSIRKVTLARIMCDNTGIKKVQRKVFEVVSKKNPLVSCDEIPSLDISLWKEKKIEEKKEENKEERQEEKQEKKEEKEEEKNEKKKEKHHQNFFLKSVKLGANINLHI